ncbi:MAG TPA: class I SAM-dependent methyltransferase [Terracidiphilus sp.]|jgi:SAM-dependent methyltransferase
MNNLAVKNNPPERGPGPGQVAYSGAPSSGYGAEYAEWKHWTADSFGALSTREACDFNANLRKARTELPSGSVALDIGFGNGAFLEYGRRRGWQMHGTEANPALVDHARLKGFRAIQAEDLNAFPENTFDLVSAFDVLEHIPLESLPGFLLEVRRVLKPGGLFLARFPNGDSPIGRHLQNGDPTHRTAIGTHRAKWLAEVTRFQVVYVWHEVQALWAGPTHTPHRLFAVPTKKLMNAFLNLLFSPRDPLPFCSPNLVMILRKLGEPAAV